MAEHDMDSTQLAIAYWESVDKAGGIARVSAFPNCDFCKMRGITRSAEYDFKTVEGPWAFGCQDHFDGHHRYDKLATGMGQKLILDSED